jgi:hypothetical protein
LITACWKRADHAVEQAQGRQQIQILCTPEAGDELYPNGLLVFNIARILAHIQAHADRFPVEPVELAKILNYGDADLNEEAICGADLSRPILFAEIAPGRYNLSDGHHRIAKARPEGARTVFGRRLRQGGRHGIPPCTGFSQLPGGLTHAS